MEQTIRLMIEQAETEESYSLIEYVKQLIDELVDAVNRRCPLFEACPEEYVTAP